MVTMAHEYAGDDDSLLVTEIRVIIALMTVRLINESFPDQNVVPVPAISFTGSRHGRILQAHMDHHGLVIRKSKFYDFSQQRNAHLGFFLRQMTCGLQGSTLILHEPDIDFDFSVALRARTHDS